MGSPELLQARILEWVSFPSPGDLPNPGIKPGSPRGRRLLHQLSHRGNGSIIPRDHVARWASRVALAGKNRLPVQETIGDSGSIPGSGRSPGGEPPGGLAAHGVATNTFIFRVQGTAHTLTPPPGRLPVCGKERRLPFPPSWNPHITWIGGEGVSSLSSHCTERETGAGVGRDLPQDLQQEHPAPWLSPCPVGAAVVGAGATFPFVCESCGG